jgi:hypothetical protein
MKDNKWLRLLAYVTGLVNQELLLQNEYLAAEEDSAGAPASPLASVRSGEVRARRNRQTTGAQGSGSNGLCGQARHHPGLVSEADRQQIRRFQTPQLSGSPTNRARD